MERLAVGFDLDMTLIDTGPGIGAVLDVLGEELGVEFAIAEITAALGPPLHHVFADYLPAERVPAAVDRFRALYPDLAIEPVSLLPGAAESVAAVRRHGGRVVVVTGKHGPNARLHLDHLGVDLDHLGGGVWGVGKADVLLAEGVSVYVGDHVHDVEGAHAAGALSVSVLTGGSSEDELRAGGTDVVLASLLDFPAWLDGYVAGAA